MQKYKFFDHTADIGCEVFGKTRKELFANAATALFDLILNRKANSGTYAALFPKIRYIEKTISLEGNDLEDLLNNFLREILYLFCGKKLVTTDCRIIELTSQCIVAHLQIERYNIKKHSIKTEIKAVTYHGLRIRKTTKGWKVRVIFDA